VDDVVIFQSPISWLIQPNGNALNMFAFDLNTVFSIMSLVGVPWHPIKNKGQDFMLTVKYVSFLWDLENHHVSLPDKNA